MELCVVYALGVCSRESKSSLLKPAWNTILCHGATKFITSRWRTHQIHYGTVPSPWETSKILSYPTTKKFYYGAPCGDFQKSYTIPTLPPVLLYHTPAINPLWFKGSSALIFILIPTLSPLYYGGKRLYQFLLIISDR
jgi:hypothetical protein